MTAALDTCVAHTAYQAELQRKLDAYSKDISEGRAAPYYRSTERDLIAAGNNVMPLDAKYRQALTICLYDLKTRLAAGTLTAKAFKCPYSLERGSRFQYLRHNGMP